MIQDLGEIFLGRTPSVHRKFITILLKFLKAKGTNTIIIPCAGYFTLSGCAISAGFKPEQIHTSDISLFSSLLGYLASNKPISSSIGFILSDDFSNEYNKLNDDTERVAFIFWLMKYTQLNEKVLYKALIKKDLIENKNLHIQKIKEKLKEFLKRYAGINYEILDLRQVPQLNLTEKSVIILNPPAFSKGYSKMFKFEPNITFPQPFVEFDMKKEYLNFYAQLKNLPCPAFIFRYGHVKGLDDSDVCFMRETVKSKENEYWLCTKKEVLKGFEYENHIEYTKQKPLQPLKNKQGIPYAMFSDKDILTPDNKIYFLKVKKEVGLYYRNLFVHKLGDVQAEVYFLTFINGKIFSVSGWDVSKVFRLQKEYAFEVFGLSVNSKKYPSINTLFMMFITCKEFGNWLNKSITNKNRLFTIKGIATTCLTKYRKSKKNTGILNLISREDFPGGFYKLKYQTDWHDRTYKDCIELYLKTIQEGKHGTSNDSVLKAPRLKYGKCIRMY